MATHNEDERRQWVLNDEGLYQRWKASQKNMRQFLRTERALIDKVIENVRSGKQPAHYLAYGRKAGEE